MTQYRLTPSFLGADHYMLFMLDTLISDLQSSDPLVRVEAAPRLGHMGASAAEAIPSLLSLTQDESQHPVIRVMAAAAVGRIDPAQTVAVIPILIDALNSDDAPLQGAAADELGSLGKHAEPALPALFRLLEDDCAAVRSTAAEAIWRITGDRTPANQVGRVLLRSKDWLDRQVGGGLLVLLGDERRSRSDQIAEEWTGRIGKDGQGWGAAQTEPQPVEGTVGCLFAATVPSQEASRSLSFPTSELSS